MDWLYLLLAAAAGAVIYAIIVHKKPGVQPGEELIDKLIAAMHSHSVTQTTALAQVIPAAIARAAAVAEPPAAPAPAAPAPAAPSPAPAPSIAAAPPPPAVPAAAAAAQAAPGAGTPAKVAPEWPRIVEVGGARIWAKAPINPTWEPTGEDIVFGSGERAGVDPSNGDQASPPLPLRSPALFPLQYVIVDGHVIGTPTIIYGTRGFNSDSEVLDYARRMAERNANLAEWQANENALNDLQVGQFDIRTGGVDDLCFLFKHWSELFMKVGPRNAANLGINWVAGQSSTKPWPNLPDTPPDVYRWDDSTYAGPMRALLP